MMMPGGRAGGQTLTALVTHKQESLQYLTVDSATYLHWRTLARSLNLSSDCDVAVYLLHHYEKTSDLQLTQCVKCSGPVVQYCVPCNIYMTQPTTPPPSLPPHDGTALSVCDDAILSSDTILLDLGDVVETDQFLLQDIVAMRTDGSKVDTTPTPVVEEGREEVIPATPVVPDRARETGRGQNINPKDPPAIAPPPPTPPPAPPSRLRMLMETCTKEGFLPLNHPSSSFSSSRSSTTTPRPPPAAKSLLTPDVLEKLKSRVQKPAESAITLETCSSGRACGAGASAITAAAGFHPALTSPNVGESSLLAESVTTQKEQEHPPLTETLQKAVDSLHYAHVPTESLLSPEKAVCQQSASAPQQGAECLPSPVPGTWKDTCLPSPLPAPTEADCLSPTECSAPPARSQPMRDAEGSSQLGVVLAVEEMAHSRPLVVDGVLEGMEKPSPAVSLTATGKTETLLPVVVKTEKKDVPKVGKWEEDDSDYHCEPLFTAPREDRKAHPTGAKSGRKAMTSGHPSVSSSVAQSSTAMTTRHSPRKRRSSHPDNKDNADRDSADDPQQTEKSESLEGQVIIVTNHGDNIRKLSRAQEVKRQSQSRAQEVKRQSQSRAQEVKKQTQSRAQEVKKQSQSRAQEVKKQTQSRAQEVKKQSQSRAQEVKKQTQSRAQEVKKQTQSRAQEVKKQTQSRAQEVKKQSQSRAQEVKKQSQAPVYRSKRIAARMAARLHSGEASDARPRVNGQVSSASGEVSSTHSDVRNVSDEVSSFRGKVNNTKHTVGDGDGKILDVDSKVSVMLDWDSPQDTATAPHKRRKGNYSRESKTYECRLCGEGFRLKADRTLHVKERHGDRPYACTQCSATFTMAGHLRAHMTQHSDVKPHACSLCPRTFGRAYDLKTHHLTHCTERPVVCEVCGVRLKTFRFLKSHMRTHNQGDKPFICQLCGKAFRWRCNLTDHLRIHNNDKRFTCPQCGVQCIQSGSLRRHMERKHNPHRPRPFVCDVCGEARFDKTQFDKHMMIHTGEKPHVCDVCGAAFIQANALLGHRKIHTDREGKSHLCSLCGAAFKVLSSVKKHMNKVHNTHGSQLSIVSLEIIDLE
ncbi:uncharacterized protein LOC143277824 [Babylonia areolata]|uniref:uncharacterized protein LOC143277824 n=1 Tax=Babylonia areolata TaxID=304850 RepID=UPI003FD51AAE